MAQTPALDFSVRLPYQFEWRQSNGRKIKPSDMRTSHVFHTLRMIWNNRMPNPVPDNPKFYTFDQRFYPEEYLKEALVQMWFELQRREDIPPKFLRQLDWMFSQLPQGSELLGT